MVQFLGSQAGFVQLDMQCMRLLSEAALKLPESQFLGSIINSQIDSLNTHEVVNREAEK
jgi:hypothetical protein